MNNNLTIRPYDIMIWQYEDNDGKMTEVVRFKNQLAYNETFIAECREWGVKTYVKDKELMTATEENIDNEEEVE